MLRDMEYESLLNKVGSFYRTVTGSQNDFGEVRVGEDFSTQAPVRIQPMREEYTIQRGGKQYTVSNKVYTIIDEISEGDYVVIDDIKYLIIGVENEAGEDHHYKLLVVKY